MVTIEEIREYKRRTVQEAFKGCGDSEYMDVMTRSLACEDTDWIPKVPDAGMTFESPSAYQLMHNGIKMLTAGYEGRWQIDLIRGFRGHFKPREEKVFHEIIKTMPANAVMLSLGCSWPYYALWFGSVTLSPRIYVVEPLFTALEWSKNNFAFNRIAGSFIRGSFGPLPQDNPACGGAERIDAESFLQTMGIAHVNLLHIQVQRNERHVLHMLERSIRLGKIDILFISTPYGDEQDLCRDFLLHYHYQIVAEHPVMEGYVPDGLLVAKRPGAACPDHVPVSKVPKGCRT